MTSVSAPHAEIDPRGPRFTAGVTAFVVVVVLLTAPSPVGIALLALQTLFFLLGAVRGVQFTPTAYAFKAWVRPRLAPPAHLEDARPPRFAQQLGLVFMVVALVGYLSGVALVGAIATGLALVAALLNAVFGLCLGCELYLLIRRLVPTHSENNKKEAIA